MALSGGALSLADTPMKTPLAVATTPWLWDAMHDAPALCDQAQWAEAQGFHSFWLPENHFGARGAVPAPLLSLAAVAARTTRIRLGCTSYLLPIRNAVLAAEEVAVLDHLSGGRLLLGLGRGIQDAMFRAFDVDVADKRKLFRANLDIMRRAWRGDTIAQDRDGAPVRLSPLPLQQPSPPLWVAAFGPLALKQVAGLGLPYLASPLETLDALEGNYRDYHAAVAAAGLPAVTTVPVMRSVYVSDRRAEVAAVKQAMLAMLPPRVREDGATLDQRVLVGDAAYVGDRLQEYRERLALTHLVVRAGGRGIDAAAQRRSHERLMAIAAA